MKVRVIKAFKDEKKIRFEGAIYETDQDNAIKLRDSGYVKLLDPIKEDTTLKPKMEKKKRKRIVKK